MEISLLIFTINHSHNFRAGAIVRDLKWLKFTKVSHDWKKSSIYLNFDINKINNKFTDEYQFMYSLISLILIWFFSSVIFWLYNNTNVKI